MNKKLLFSLVGYGLALLTVAVVICHLAAIKEMDATVSAAGRQLVVWSGGAALALVLVLLGIILFLTKRIAQHERVARETHTMQQHIEFILGATNTGLDIIDSQFNVRYMDPAWQKLYGDPAGRKCYEYFMDRDEVCPGCGVVKALGTKSVTVIEEVLVKENNRPIQVTTIPFQNEEREWLVAEMKADISQRKQAEEALRTSKERYEHITSNIPGLVYQFVMHPDGSYSMPYASAGSRELFGLEPETIVRDAGALLDLIHPDDVEVFNLHVRESADSLKPWRHELRTLVDGKERWYQGVSHPHRQPNGDILWDGVLLDITERKQAEEELRKHRDHLEELVAARTSDLKAGNDELQREITERKRVEQALRESEKHLRVKLDYIMSPDEEPSSLSLLDLVTLEDLQQIQDAFAQAMGVASIISDVEGHPITTASNFCGVCEIIRSTEKGNKRCIRSDKIVGEKAMKTMRPTYEKCLSCGFVDASAPIIVAGKHIANWLIGQSNAMGVDRGRIEKYAVEIGADVDAMLAAYEKMPQMSIEKFEQILNLLWLLAKEISTLGYNNLKLTKDIAERKQAEDELRRLRNLLSNIVNSMPSVLVGVDLQGRVTQWNREAARATGIAAEQAQGRLLDEVFPKLQSEMEQVRKAIRTRQVQEDLKVPRRVDGETRFSDVIVYPLLANGVEGAVIRIDDVTERVHIEEMMMQTEKMMSVGALAAGMAHEINNPLGGILQGAQNIQRRFSTELAKNVQVARECGTSLDTIRAYLGKREIQGFIEGIRESGTRAARIVANMLQFSRRSEAQVVLADLPELVERALELAASDYDLKKKYDFRRIEIVREFEPDLPQVPVVVTEIEQVVLNLLKNAAQAMQEEQSDEKKPHIILRMKREGDWVRLVVEDNGPGMNEPTSKRAFEPFFTTKGIGVGTGLGLSVSYMIITNNHKGTMTLDSTPGKGTRFVIHLPLERKAL